MRRTTEFLKMLERHFQEVDKFYHDNNITISYEDFIERYFDIMGTIVMPYVEEARYSRDEGRQWYYGY